MLKKKSKILGFTLSSLLMLSMSVACNKEDNKPQDNSSADKVSTQSEQSMNLKANHDQAIVQTVGENIKWYSFNEGMEKAKKEKKYIIVDFYTEWCTYCKKMDSETYSDKKVYSYINDKFVPIKVNAESKVSVKFDGKTMTEQELAQGFGVNSYPTIFFMSGEKDAIGTAPGFVDAKQFYNLATFVGTDSYKTTTFQKYQQASKT